ncbi:hypothetical protein [Aquimarina sp. RZ0]|uniref:hypothetical protein n=1 Tax=Aquimarina sp. RZ0 TaxID=2607730 RepID=UPI0034D010FA
MEITFNRILKPDFPLVLPMIQKLMNNELSNTIVSERFAEMFEQYYECWGIYLEIP